MANAIKRQGYANHEGFGLRVSYYFWEKAKEVLAAETPDATDLLFAKAVYAGQVSVRDMCLTVITNTSIGSAIDNDSAPSDSDIEWAVKTDNQFHNLALAYETSGLIGE